MTNVREALRADLAPLISLGVMLHAREVLAHAAREEQEAAAAQVAAKPAVAGTRKNPGSTGGKPGPENDAKVRSSVQHLLTKPNFSRSIKSGIPPRCVWLHRSYRIATTNSGTSTIANAGGRSTSKT